MSYLWFAIFGKALNPLSRLKSSSKTEHWLASKRWYREQSTQRPKQIWSQVLLSGMRTPAALEVIACLKTFLLWRRLRVQLPKNLSLRSLDPKIQSRPMRKPPLYPIPMNQRRPLAKIRKRSILRRNGTRKTLFRLQKTTSLRMRRNGIIEEIRSAIIVKKRAILLRTAQNFQKTSVSFSNFRAGDSWW